MTAQRWWVKLGARWLARVDGVSDHLRLAMLGLTGVSTASLTLRQYGYGEYAGPFIVGLGAATLAYTYLYTEGGVWNQMSRDRADLSSNFAGPSMRMGHEFAARGLLAGLQQRELTDSERDAVQQELDETFAQYRDGIEIESGDLA